MNDTDFGKKGITSSTLEDDLIAKAKKLVGGLNEEVVVLSDFVNSSSPREDMQELFEAAYARELQRRDGTLDENEKKYAASEVNLLLNENGKMEEEIIVLTTRFYDGQRYFNLTALGYEMLPPDVREAIGSADDVIDQWVPVSERTAGLYDASKEYYRGEFWTRSYDSWEEYRDSRGLAPEDNKVVSQTVDGDLVSPPRDTPVLEQENSLLKSK